MLRRLAVTGVLLCGVFANTSAATASDGDDTTAATETTTGDSEVSPAEKALSEDAASEDASPEAAPAEAPPAPPFSMSVHTYSKKTRSGNLHVAKRNCLDVRVRPIRKPHHEKCVLGTVTSPE